MANLSNINNRFLVTTGGNVLIGSTAVHASGSALLQVTGDSDFIGSSGRKMVISPDTTSLDVINYPLHFRTGSQTATEKMRIDTVGNVMIGIDSTLGSSILTIKQSSVDTGIFLVQSDGNDDKGWGMYSRTNGGFRIRRVAATTITPFSIDTSGNVTFSYGIAVTGTYSDSSGDVGTAGQILSSTATGTNWISHSTANDFLTGLSFNTGDGVLTATVSNQSNVTVDLDGRYLTSYTETDTLQNVCSRGNSTSTAINMTGSGASGYLYVAGNAASAAPTNNQGMAFAYNNSGGSRENELFFNPGIVTPADNATYYFAIINEYLNSSSGNARTTDTLFKLYGDGNLELVGPTSTSTIANTFWRMPKVAAPNTGYYLSKSAGSIDLQWTAPPSGGSGTVTSVATGNGLTGGTITTTGTLTMSGSYTGNFAATSVQPGGSGQGILSAGNVDRNLKYTGGGSSTDGGFTGFNNAGGHLWQLYGSGNDYGFLDGNWAGWDLQKTKNGNLYMNGSTTYYVNTTSNSFLAGNLSVGLVNTSYGIFCSSAISGTNIYANSSGGSFVFGASTSEGEYIQRPGGSNDICLIAGGSIGINTTTPSSYSNGSIGGGNTSLVIAGGGNQGITISGSSSAKIVLSKNTTPECFIQSDVNNAGTMEFFTNGTGATRTLKLLPTGQVKLDQYGSGSYTGTAAYNLSVDSSGNIIETSGGGGGGLTPAIQEQTWTFSRAQLNSGFGGSGYTLIAAQGSGTFVIVQSSWWYTTGTSTSSGANLNLEARQENQIPGTQTVTKIVGTQFNYMTSQNGGNGMFFRDVPISGLRPYAPNKPTTFHRTSGNQLPSQFTELKLKLQWRVFDSSNI